MHVPKALHAVRRPDIAEMTVGLLRGKCFVDDVLLAGQHLFVAGIGGQLDGRIDQLTEPDVTIAADLGVQVAQIVLVHVNDHEVAVDRVVDAAADLAPDLHLPQIERRKLVHRLGSGKKTAGASRRDHDGKHDTIKTLPKPN